MATRKTPEQLRAEAAELVAKAAKNELRQSVRAALKQAQEHEREQRFNDAVECTATALHGLKQLAPELADDPEVEVAEGVE